MYLSRGLAAIVIGFFPAWWALFYQALIGFALAYVVARQQAGEKTAQRKIVTFAGIAGGGGGLVFALFGLAASLLSVLLAALVMWLGVSLALDRYLDVDWEASQRITAPICLYTWLIWFIVGIGIYLLRSA